MLRPFAAGHYRDAQAAREHPDTVTWVNALPQPDGETMAEFVESLRRDGKLLHLAVLDSANGDYLGEILLFPSPRPRQARSASARLPT